MKIIMKDPELFRQMLIRKGYSQISMSKEVGIAKSYACQIANGIRNPGPVVAKKISEILETNFDEIFFIQSGSKSEIPKVKNILQPVAK